MKLRRFGHVSTSSGFAQVILQGTMKGKRRRGLQKRWGDIIKEWTGRYFLNSAGAAEYSTSRKGVVTKSSVVPKRPC